MKTSWIFFCEINTKSYMTSQTQSELDILFPFYKTSWTFTRLYLYRHRFFVFLFVIVFLLSRKEFIYQPHEINDVKNCQQSIAVRILGIMVKIEIKQKG